MAAPTTQQTPTTNNPIMRFRTQGGAHIDLYPHTWSMQMHNNNPRQNHNGFQWICQGCDTGGRDHRLGWGYREDRPDDSRRAANQHASECHAMHKPTTA